jgi:putative transposase
MKEGLSQMTLGHSLEDKNIIERNLCTMFSREFLNNLTTETGLVKRERKIDPVIMFWVLTLSFGVRLQRSLASLKRSYEKESKQSLSDSSWYYRFTPELVAFLKACVLHAVEQLAQEQNRVLSERLNRFEDVLIQDSTIVRLHESLYKKWPAARSKKPAAGVKIGVLVSAIADGPKRIALYPESTNDLKTLRIGPWIKDRIILLDLGYYKYQLFTRISENKGFFVSRLKTNANPTIINSNISHRGRSINVEGRTLQEVLPKLKRQNLDVNIKVSFKRRSYKSKQKEDQETFRMVAIFNEEEEKYHLYITNIPCDVLDSREIAELYGARWDIELIFKELKSKYALDVVNTTNPQVIEAYIWIAILTLLISRRIYTIVRRRNPGKKMVRYTRLRWSTIFAENASDQLTAILNYLGIQRTFETIASVYDSQALDPHVNRHRLTEEWWA